MSTDKRAPRPAATLVVTRDAPGGLELLLLRRAEKGDHNSGAWVFPGGLVDAADQPAHAVCQGLDDTTASRVLGVEHGGLDFYVAAIRECFEEAGVLFATDAAGRPVDLQGESGARLSQLRGPLHRSEAEFGTVCRDFGLQLRPDRLHYIAHWLTPVGRAKRFDTRFFVAVLPEGQSSAHDTVETVDQVWLTPAQALAPENARRLMTPTRATIEQLAGFADTSALLAWAQAPRQVQRVLPRLAMGAEGPCPILPGHPAWHEVGRLDPEGRGDIGCEARPGVAVSLAPGVLRLVAAGSLQASYLVECAFDGWAVVDPGPRDAGHRDALIAAAPGPIRWICLTDGDPAQARGGADLQALTGARLLGPNLTPDTAIGELLRVCPGPLPGHSSYLLSTEGLLFAGTQQPTPAWLAEHQVAWLARREGFLTPVDAISQEASGSPG